MYIIKNKWLRSCACCCGILLLGTACGNQAAEDPAATSSTDASAAAAFQIADLLSQEEAAGFLGTEVNPAEITLPEIAPAQPYLLFYETTALDRFIQVGVIPDSPELAGIGQTASQMYLSTRDEIVENEIAVEGVGDEAFWGTLGLHILQGPYYLTIGCGNTNDPANLELAKEIAAVVLPRLP